MTEYDKELVQHLVELILTDPRQFPLVVLRVYNQRVTELAAQRITAMLQAHMEKFVHEVLKSLDDMDNTSDIDHEGGPQ